MIRTILPAALAAAALTLAGCSGQDTTAAEQAPAEAQPATADAARAAATTIAEDNTSGDYEAFWNALDPASQAVIGRDDYVRYKTELCPPPAAGLPWTAGKAALTSPTTATVRMSRGAGALSLTETWRLKHDGQRWRLVMDGKWSGMFRGVDLAALAQKQRAAGLCG